MKVCFYTQTQKIVLSILFLTLFLSNIPITHAQTCGGNIIRGSSGAGSFLDPDGDGDIVAGATGFSNCGPFVDEMTEFEDLRNPLGCTSCQRPWVAIPGFNEATGDLWAGGASCGNTEIAPISATDGTYAYYTIIDPDGVCNNGDELLIFRIRVAAASNGSFSYSLLIDTDGKLGASDPDGIQCASKVANGGFEYEVIANPANNRDIEVYDINGQVATGTLVAAYDNDVYYNQANACRSACGCAGGDVYHTFAIQLTAIGKSCTDKGYRFAGGTASSGNGTVISNTSVSDVGGIGPNPSCPDTLVPCNCCQECDDTASAFYCGGNTSTCMMACLNACVAEVNGGATDLPVEFTHFDGILENNEVRLHWEVASELNNDYYIIERSVNGEVFQAIGQVAGAGTTQDPQYYTYYDDSPQEGTNYYRLRQVDYDGTFSFSKTIAVEFNAVGTVSVYPTLVTNSATITMNTAHSSYLNVPIVDVNGRPIKSFIRPVDEGFNKIEFSTEDLAPGMYFLSLEHNKIRNLLKIVKGL